MKFPADAVFKRVYSYLPYSYWQIVHILNEYYDAHLVRIRAYKEGRYTGYKNHYEIHDNKSGRVINGFVRLNDLRKLFARQGFPLDINKTGDEYE
ncbi:MAG: hypothetical protein J5981_03585 [Lachnospira sp.]|nr:hypothetical protein [Lachnospira sp.]